MDMSEDVQDEGEGDLTHRSPTFTPEEVNILIDHIEKHKTVLLNKSICAVACRAKENAWKKITKDYNASTSCERTVEGLKMKWVNLKKIAKKVSNNLLDVKYEEYSRVTKRVVGLMCEAENGKGFDLSEVTDELDETVEMNDITKTSDAKDMWSDEEDKVPLEDADGSNSRDNRMGRSMNFSPDECSLLLQCVKAEKNHIFCKDTTNKANQLKVLAWERVTKLYNNRSPNKRPVKVLQTKFNNMKKMAKRVGFKRHGKFSHEGLVEDSPSIKKKIKEEPVYEFKINTDEVPNDSYVNSHNGIDTRNGNTDPLCTVLNTENDSGCFGNFDAFVPAENQEVVKLKMDLLKYQIETAKLERERVKQALEAEISERESRAIENALRVRAARLEVVAAEGRLPHDHPALHFTPTESRAQHCLHYT